MSAIVSQNTAHLLTDIAFGVSSGHTTISKFRDTHVYKGAGTWAITSWEALKTAVKAHTLMKSDAHIAIWTTFTAWSVTYSICCLRRVRAYEPNTHVHLTPILIVITRIALNGLEYTVQPRKAVVTAITTAICTANLSLEYKAIDEYLPAAAKITIFVFGDPLSKLFVVAETAWSLFLRIAYI